MGGPLVSAQASTRDHEDASLDVVVSTVHYRVMRSHSTRLGRPILSLLGLLLATIACGGSSGGGKSSPADTVAATETAGETTVASSGLGCECAGPGSACGDGFCSDFLVCTTNDDVECQADKDCGCDARCIALGAKQTCQIPCEVTADCPGTLTCATLAVPWTTTAGATLTSGCNAPAAPASVTWEADIQPIVAQSCAGCHTGGGTSGGVHFDTYADTQVQVSNCPEGQTRSLAAVMAEKVSPSPPCGGRMPLGGAPLSEAQVQRFADWVAAGAPER